MEPNRLRRAIIFDGDDTLWEIQVFYDETKEQFYDLMVGIGFDRERVVTMFGEIDRANVGKYGFSRHRFPTSMQEVYRYFCEDYGREVDPAILAQTYAIGASVFDRKPVLMAGAVEVLSCLRSYYELYLYSGGDVEVQANKVSYLQLNGYFTAVHFVERKGEIELQRILQKHDLSSKSTWMVGNSARSDINPALRVGLRCIWVRTHSWDYDAEVLTPGRVWEASALTDIVYIFSQVDHVTLT